MIFLNSSDLVRLVFQKAHSGCGREDGLGKDNCNRRGHGH